MRQHFDRLATKAGRLAGSPWAFGMAVLVIILWAVSGPFLGFSDTWQLVINTTTTLVTFLMVFLIQNTQNRTDEAINIKIDELLIKLKETGTGLVGSEEWDERRLQEAKRQITSQVQPDETSAADSNG